MTTMQTKMKSEAAVSIAKGIWSLRGDGKWAIQGLKSLDLEPRTGGNTNYFSIKNGIVVAQPDYVNSVHSTLGESIVPVVAIEPSTNTFRCIGTGFFISCTGLLITAAHVIIADLPRSWMWQARERRGNGAILSRPIRLAMFGTPRGARGISQNYHRAGRSIPALPFR